MLGVLLALKKVGSFLLEMVVLAVKHWRITVPILIVVLTFCYIQSLINARDEARQALIDYRAEVVEAQIKRDRENREKEDKAKARRAEQAELHQAQINAIWRKAHEYKIAKDADTRTIADLRKRLRDNIANAPARLPGVSEAASRLAEGRGECDATAAGSSYQQSLELGCAITTSDYNRCMSEWQTACDIYGCK
jgi:hypothetical protein